MDELWHWCPSMRRVIGAIYGRDEEKNLPNTIKAMMRQTYPFHKIIYVDDASLDSSPEIAESLGVEVVRLTFRHPSWVGTPMLSRVINEGIEAIYRVPDVDYFLIMGSDTILAKNYLEILVEKSEDDERLVLCSGMVLGEYTVPSAVRGTGRLYRFDWWDTYIKRFPYCYMWESYPVYKANSLGFRTRAFKEAEMYTVRPTAYYKPLYGHAMRELGYIPPYALARCLIPFLKRKPKTGARMLQTYLTSSCSVVDEEVSKWLKSYQASHILKIILNPRIILNYLMPSKE